MINIEELRQHLEKVIDTRDLSDLEVLSIYETESLKRNSFLKSIKKGIVNHESC